MSRVAAALTLLAATLVPAGAAEAETLYTKTRFDLVLQDPKAKVLDDKARKSFVLEEVYNKDCSCFSRILVNGEALEMRNDPESPGLIAWSDQALFLIGEFESRACNFHYFVLSFHHPAWPEPVRSPRFGDCNEPKSVAFEPGGRVIVRFAHETVTVRDGAVVPK